MHQCSTKIDALKLYFVNIYCVTYLPLIYLLPFHGHFPHKSGLACLCPFSSSTFSRRDAFSASILLVGRQEEHSARKKFSDGVLALLSVWSVVQMICIWPKMFFKYMNLTATPSSFA